MPAHRRPTPSGERRPRTNAHRILPIALGLALIGVAGAVGPSVVENVTGGDPPNLSLTALPADTPAQGLIYAGLRPAKSDSLCAGAYTLDDETCTYGPDTAPAGLKVGNDTAPVTPKSPALVAPTRETAGVPTDAEIARDEGGSAMTPGAPAIIPDPAPGQADFVMGAHDVACESDGHDSKRVQVLYLQQFGTVSRYTDFLGSIRTWATGVDQIFDASAAETGGSRHIRFVTTPQCQIDVDEVQLPVGALDSFTNTIAALQKLGYNRTDRKYLMFTDANVYCGIASYVNDRRSGLGNRNNGGPSYGRIDAGCWSSTMAAHELAHELGAVLTGSPNASGAGGCTDGYDLLCAPDRSGRTVRTVCPRSHANRLDCGHDDYFSTNPKPGSYLTKNWNVATSEFLLRSDGGDDIPDSGQADPAAGAPSPAAPPSTAPASAGPPPSTEASPAPASTAPGPSDSPLPGNTTTPSAETQPVKAKKSPGVQVEEESNGTAGAGPVQAVLEIRDTTSSSAELNWSAASDTATYQVSVDGDPVGVTKATRARLIGLKPDAKYQVTIKSGAAYAAKGTAETAPYARPAENTWFDLNNALTGGAADLYAARAANGTPMTLAESDGDAQQQWELVPAGKNSYSLVSRATGKCAVPLDGNLIAGVPIVQGDCASDDSGHWQLQASDYGFTLRTTASELVIGVGNQRFGQHRVLVLQDGNGQRHQSWTAVPD
ncbi:RICIN domain-containing protein [Actinoplanes sp. NPDC051411]|uniref:RICIN domain-containing protein n=1 Tax=Actinoplanes sp. NPDC051411 TaxID=3155522 RepID=UPI003416C52E